MALGCSFTDPNYHCDDPSAKHLPENLKGGWPMWPEIFTERLSKKDNVEYTLINRGQSGSSMEYSSKNSFHNDSNILLLSFPDLFYWDEYHC